MREKFVIADPAEVVEFWLDEVGPEGWYKADEARDAEIRRRFARHRDRAEAGGLALWLTYPTGTLAYLIVTDQFPRNMFRGTAKAYALDPIARAAAVMAIGRGWDRRIAVPARQFFYLPLMHSENLSEQDRAVRLIATRMDGQGADNLLHARAHREVIRRFGRFPHRNADLGRRSTAAERVHLEEGGYGAIVRAMQEAAKG